MRYGSILPVLVILLAVTCANAKDLTYENQLKLSWLGDGAIISQENSRDQMHRMEPH